MAGKVTRSISARFWEKVKKTSSCWLWIGNKNKKGYGRFWLQGRNESAQRVSWALVFGRFNRRLYILHKCDNPSCVKPTHLFLGTLADNIVDRENKNRSAKGERNGNSKLTIAKVKLIRQSADPVGVIATEFGIDRTQVYNIKKKKQWAHVV